MSTESAFKKRNLQSSIPDNWTRREQTFSGDDIIDAFLGGKEVGKTDYVRVLTAQFTGNLQNAATLAEELNNKAKEKDIVFNAIHMKAEGITNFKALFVTPVHEFVSDEFREIYTLAREIKTKAEVKDENFNLSFSFLPTSESLSAQCLRADGFFLTYDKK